MLPIVHWDDVDRVRNEVGPFRNYWTALGDPGGTVNVGVNRIEVDPGKRSTPLHMEGDEEEIFFVLGGSGLSWQYDGETEATFEVRAGDCLVHLAEGEAHSLVGGPDGIDALAFGTRAWARLTYFPRLEGARMGPAWAEKLPQHQWKREAALPDPDLPAPSARPARIVNVADVHAQEFGPAGETVRAERRDLGRTAGSVRTGIKHVTVEPGKLAAPPHCHSTQEEIFVVLDGEGVCLLGDEEHPVRRGHVVARPPGTGIAHAFRAGAEPLAFLAYGTREPHDIAYYPRSGKFFLRGVGVIGRIEQLDYWEGER